MLDKTLPHIGVLMIKNDPDHFPKYVLPEGYTFCTYEEGMRDEWSRLQYSAGQTETLAEAERIFDMQFLPYPEALEKNSVFVRDGTGTIVASAFLWDGDHFGKTLQRLHWLAVDENHQGKGIAKALVTKILEIFQARNDEDYIYLSSQTWSYPAIAIYLQFGFLPYLGEKPMNWSSNSDQFQEENETAWRIIYDQIKRHYDHKK